MSLRVRADIANQAIGLVPLTARAAAWLETHVRPLGGDWRWIDERWAFSLPIQAIPEDLLGSSGLQLHFGDGASCAAPDVTPDLSGRITLH
ncbi:hypothetical protein [uncultured Alsobacter sp.]|uniref:hypothetical protein n=1 Tax=uncultured Alsobacter sp. TaxID=1748258 RepID=UPI0025FB9CF9|nr:hypothetical protein [uncultured Alsobacter sp.]